MALLEFKLPDIGEGVAEGEVVKWLVNVGDSVKEHQAVVEDFFTDHVSQKDYLTLLAPFHDDVIYKYINI